MITGVAQGGFLAQYFDSSRYRLSEHQLDSFDDFLKRKIPSIVEDENANFVMIKQEEVEKSFDVRVENVRFTRPVVSVEGGSYQPMYPNMARILDRSYTTTVLADVVVTVRAGAGEPSARTFEGVKIGEVPLMVHSEQCYLRDVERDRLIELGEDRNDPGGYFIVDGKEKMLVTQERVVQNTPITSVKKDARGEAFVQLLYRGASLDNAVEPVALWIYARDTPDGFRVTANLPRIKQELDVGVVFRALGVETDRAIAEHVVGDVDDPKNHELLQALRPTLVHGFRRARTRNEAMDIIAPLTPYGSIAETQRGVNRHNRGMDHALYILAKQFLPGRDDSMAPKALMFGSLVRRIMETKMGTKAVTDRESFAAKRLDAAGAKLAELFLETYKELKRNAKNRMDWHYNFGPWKTTGKFTEVVNADNLSDIFNHHIVTGTMFKTMKGNWAGRSDPDEGGIVQDLDRRSFFASIAHVRRVNNPFDKNLKLTDPRKLHATQWGVLCPVDSPDGGSVGLTNNLALLCRVTTDGSPFPVMEAVERHGGVDIVSSTPLQLAKGSAVLVNGVLTHRHDDPKHLVSLLRDMRSKNEIDRTTTIHWNVVDGEVRLYTDGGRCVRPLLRAAAAAAKIDPSRAWESLFSDTLEYMDVLESQNAMIAWSPALASPGTHTHSEIHPIAALSSYVNSIPFVNHNQSPRNVYSCAQAKQASSVYSLAYRHRIEYDTGLLCNNTQAPLVTTSIEPILGIDDHPYGENTIVAVMCVSGFNQEDAVIFNRDSVERGLFSTTAYKSVSASEDSSASEELVFDDDPFLPEDTPVAEGDTIIKMLRRARAADEGDPLAGDGAELGMEVETGVRADKQNHGYVVDKVVTQTRRGAFGAVHGGVKVRLRKHKTPQVGDKVASRGGQKGTIGILLPQERMPYTREGIVPDVIVNPHAIPSRMTVGHLLECVAAKKACLSGVRQLADAFAEFDWESARETLRENGYEENSNEVMYSGVTGRPLGQPAFIGPTYYMRLKHMSADKLNVRGGQLENPIEAVTRQPTHGRANDGGLRIGEMERDILLAYGMMEFVQETFMDRSDGAVAWTDGRGHTARFNEKRDQFSSPSDDTDLRFSRRRIPHSFGVLQHELAQMGVGTRLLDDSTPKDPASYEEA